MNILIRLLKITIYEPEHADITITHVTDAAVPLKHDSRRIYNSFTKMRPKARKIYNRTAIFVQNISARVTKIQLNAVGDSSSSIMNDACARLMENGDFRVTFTDGKSCFRRVKMIDDGLYVIGRTIVQKQGTNVVTAFDANYRQITLNERERLEFDLRRSDCLRLELAVKDFDDTRYPFIMGQ